MAIPFSRFLRLVELATHEQDVQYRLHLQGDAFTSWVIHSSNTSKPVEYKKWEEMLNLRKPEKFDLEKEKNEALKNIQWMFKQVDLDEKKVEMKGIKAATYLPMRKAKR